MTIPRLVRICPRMQAFLGYWYDERENILPACTMRALSGRANALLCCVRTVLLSSREIALHHEGQFSGRANALLCCVMNDIAIVT